MNILILFFCGLYFILAFKRLDWAVMFLIMALPSYLIRFSVFSIPFTLLEAMILISFGTWILKNYKQIIENIKNRKSKINPPAGGRKLNRYPFDIEIVLLLIISFVAVFVSGLTDDAFGIWKAYFFEPALVFILILNIFGKQKKELNSKTLELSSFFCLNKVLWPLAVSALIVSILAIYQKFTGAWIFNELWAAEETRRVTSFFGYPNAVGLYLGPVVLIMIGWLASVILKPKTIESHGKRTNVYSGILSLHSFRSLHSRMTAGKIVFILLAIILSVLAIYFAKSEGALIGVVAGLVVFGLLAGKKARWVTVSLIVLAVASIMAYAPTREYAINKFLLRDLSGQFRKVQWSGTWDMLKDGRLVFGSGLANYKKEVQPYHQEGLFVRDYNDPDWHRKTVFNEEYRNKVWQPLEIYLYPHNIFLNFWVELGLAGMILFIWIIGKYLMMGMKSITNYELRITNNKFLVIGLICAMVVVIIHGLVDVPYFKNDLAIMFWIFLAMMSLINLKLKDDFRK